MRIDKDNYYIEIAKAVALRSPCIRRKVGAIIVVNDTIASTGYNGPCRGGPNCDELGCIKDKLKIERYIGYDICPGIHAEENAIINAARNGIKILGGKMYLISINPKTGEEEMILPCYRCRRMIINAGLEEVITRDHGKIVRFSVKEWAKKEKIVYEELLRRAKEGLKIDELLKKMHELFWEV